MDQEEEQLRAALREAAPDVDETGVMDTVIRKGRSAKRRRRVYRGVTVAIVVAFVAFVGFGAIRLAQDVRSEPALTSPSQPAAGVVYKNSEYGFTFSLPGTWDGYSIVTDQWEGFPNHSNSGGDPGDQPVYGPEILIRNPAWTAADPHQDIPIMVRCSP